MKINPVAWFEIYVQDISRAKIFYETVLQTKLECLANSDVEMWAFPNQNGAVGAGGALVKRNDFPSGGNSTLVYFTCDDCAVEEIRVLSSGGKIQKAKVPISEFGFISLVIDTEGNMFGLHSTR
jgi:uncharacterized protein